MLVSKAHKHISRKKQTNLEIFLSLTVCTTPGFHQTICPVQLADDDDDDDEIAYFTVR